MLLKKRILVTTVTIVLVLIELYIRGMIAREFPYGLRTHLIGDFLGILRVNNYGIAFGFFWESNLVIVAVTMVSLAFVVYIFWLKHHRESVLKCIGMVLFFSGSLCNIIDRVALGYVRDYLSFRVNGYSLPILNLSDIAIAFGIIILLIIVIKSKEDDYV